jgi:hypothetical protein
LPAPLRNVETACAPESLIVRLHHGTLGTPFLFPSVRLPESTPTKAWNSPSTLWKIPSVAPDTFANAAI